MKIKTKLLFLTAVMLSALLCSTAVFGILQLNINTLEKEQEYLDSLDSTLYIEMVEMFRFLSPGILFKTQMKTYKDANLAKTESMSNLDNLSALRKISPVISESLTTITKLDTLQSKALKEFHDSAELLIESADRIVTYTNDFAFRLNGGNIDEESKAFSVYAFNFQQVKLNINKTIGVLETSINVLRVQNSLITEEIQRLISQSYMIMGLVIVLSILLSLLIALRFSHSIIGSIKNIETNLTTMSIGNLSRDFNHVSKDEIGFLGSLMNDFQASLRGTIRKMKDLSHRSSEVKIELISTTSDTSATTKQISANLKSIDDQMQHLDNNISNSSKDIVEINSLVNNLDDHILDHMSMVEESTSSVTEMIASVQNVARLAEQSREAVEKLVEYSAKGSVDMDETSSVIESINGSVQDINKMMDLIRNITSQTNLLAMNAAIEAAHAGAQGKGFAVVAHEIRKLAEATARNSKEISKTLTEMVKKTEKASVSGHRTKDSFEQVSNQIEVFHEALMVISSNTGELDKGGKEVLEAMTALLSLASSIKEKSKTIKENSRAVDTNMSNITGISSKVTNSVTEINDGFYEVASAVSGLELISDRVGTVSNDLNLEINKFITEIDETA